MSSEALKIHGNGNVSQYRTLYDSCAREIDIQGVEFAESWLFVYTVSADGVQKLIEALNRSLELETKWNAMLKKCNELTIRFNSMRYMCVGGG